MPGVIVDASELLSEAMSLQELAKDFVDSAAGFHLSNLSRDIRMLSSQPGRTSELSIPESRMLYTRPSLGEFEPDNKSGRKVYAEISGIWDVKSRKETILRQSVNVVEFCGKASLVVHVRECSTARSVVRWKMEMGTDGAPGCYFHTWCANDSGFPVPRHPSVFVSPMSAIEFVLGELFQAEWRRALSSSPSALRWKAIQRHRMQRLLQWQRDSIESSTDSAWIAIKVATPQPLSFLPAAR